MNFTIKVKLTASSKLIAAINLLAGGVSLPEAKEFVPAPLVAEKTEPVTEKTTAPATTRTRKPKEVVEDPKPEVKEEPTEEVKDKFKEANTEPVTLEMVRAAMQENNVLGKREEGKALIAKHGVTRLTDLPESEFPEMLKELQDLKAMVNGASASASATAEVVTFEMVKEAVQSKAQSGKRSEIKNLLNGYGVERYSLLTEDQYSKFLTEVNAL